MTFRRYGPIAAVVLALGVAGCSNNDNMPDMELTMLPAGNDLADTDTGDTPIRVAAGAMVRRGNVYIGCPADGAACTVNVVDGEATYEPTGGTPVVTAASDSLTPPDGHGLPDTGNMPIRVAAGAMMRHGNVYIGCPADGAACTVAVEDGAVTNVATGGMPVVTAASDPLTPPDGHGLADTGDTPIMVAAGDEARHGNVDIACPADGAACTVNVADGAVTNVATGGMPVVTAASDSLTPPDGHGLANTGDTPIMVAAGGQARHGNVDIACPADGAACTVNVADGAVTHVATGGMPEVTAASDSLTPPAGHGLANTGDTPIMVAAGGQARHGNVDIACPADGAACTVNVADGAVTHVATGGMPEVTAASDSLTPPAGHGLANTGDTPIMVAAGGQARHGNVDIACPADGAACTVNVADGAVTNVATGGMPVVTAASDSLTPPDGHGLANTGDTPIMVAAGDEARHGNVDIACPADGAACTVNVADGAVTNVATGGMPVVTAASDSLTPPAGHGLANTGDTPIMVAAGGQARHGNVDIACPADGAACTVNVADGAVTHVATGGMPEVTAASDSLTPPAGHGLANTGDTPIMVAAGGQARHGNVDIACPADGAACTVNVADGAVTHVATGGTPVVTAAFDSLTLPDGHDLVAATLGAGMRQDGKRGVVIECPAGGDACVVEVAEDGSATYDATGGMPTVEINQMILAANNGPLGGSDGDHAEGLFNRMLRGIERDAFEALANTGLEPNGADVVQSTLAFEPMVGVSVTRNRRDAAPTFGLALGFEVFSRDPDDRDQPDSITLDRRSDSTIPELPSGWNGAAFSSEIDGGSTVHAVVYSDIEGPRQEQRDVFEPSNRFFDLPPTSLNSEGRPEGVRFDNRGGTGIVLAIPDNLPEAGQPFELSLGFGEDRFHNYLDVLAAERDWREELGQGEATDLFEIAPVDHDNDDATPAITEARLMCVASPCEVQTSDDGPTVAGTWTLVYQVQELVGQEDVDVPEDAEYLTLGAWLSLPDSPDGTYQAGAFADGRTPFEGAELTGLTGTVTYEGEGSATGSYSTITASVPGGPRASSQVGAFVADAMLTARFDGPLTDGDVSGVIDNFTENGQRLGDWQVTLGEAAIGGGVLAGPTGGAADGRSLIGQWGVRFFRDGNETSTNPHPGYAAGTFNATTRRLRLGSDDEASHPSAVNLIGAFGTRITNR